MTSGDGRKVVPPAPGKSRRPRVIRRPSLPLSSATPLSALARLPRASSRAGFAPRAAFASRSTLAAPPSTAAPALATLAFAPFPRFSRPITSSRLRPDCVIGPGRRPHAVGGGQWFVVAIRTRPAARPVTIVAGWPVGDVTAALGRFSDTPATTTPAAASAAPAPGTALGFPIVAPLGPERLPTAIDVGRFRQRFRCLVAAGFGASIRTVAGFLLPEVGRGGPGPFHVSAIAFTPLATVTAVTMLVRIRGADCLALALTHRAPVVVTSSSATAAATSASASAATGAAIVFTIPAIGCVARFATGVRAGGFGWSFVVQPPGRPFEPAIIAGGRFIAAALRCVVAISFDDGPGRRRRRTGRTSRRR